jgi:uncharacterized membrane-anchored protein YhcB (DUF1043 family)
VTIFIICCVVVGWVWVRLVIRTRRRAQANIEEARALQAQFDRAQTAAATKLQARFAQYQREMSARSMDRYHGLLKNAEDPTFEEWLADKGHREEAAS